MSTGWTIDDRLRNWSVWRIRNVLGGGNFARVRMEHRVDGEGFDAQDVIRNDEADAAEVDKAVQKLLPDLRAVIEPHYIDNRPLRVKLQRSGHSERRYYEVLAMGRRAVENTLSEWATEKKARADAERERLACVMGRARGFYGAQ